LRFTVEAPEFNCACEAGTKAKAINVAASPIHRFFEKRMPPPEFVF
jgi:hypothetical protein